MHSNPYFRICRPFADGGYFSSQDMYFADTRYAGDRVHFVRAYHLLEQQLLRIFEFVEPADGNLPTYSHETYSLLLRACTEFEANARAILVANGYQKTGNWNIEDYYRVQGATRLADYEITIPIWSGPGGVFRPFKEWHLAHSLTWYRDYQSVKHNRSQNFQRASLGNLIEAVSGVFCILFSQFHFLAFDPYHQPSMFSSDDSGPTFFHERSLFVVRTCAWPADERYNFNWNSLKNSAQPFKQFAF